MIKTRLFSLVTDSKKYIFENVIFQWIGLISNIVMICTIAGLLEDIYNGTAAGFTYWIVVILCTVVVRVFCEKQASNASYYASRSVKRTLRAQIYQKLLKLGAGYSDFVPSAEVVQLAGEGVEQLETYFGAYLPQFFYSLLAPVTLFFVVGRISLKIAVVLLVCVPLIPMAIVVVQKIAKRILSKYWGQYTQLGDSFLENLQGLTTLKIYQADEARHQEMNREAEHFRVVTMKVLTMQLNSIIIMDIVAYGGAALGIAMAVSGFVAGTINLYGAVVIILLSADFFLPMRRLGSYFHVAMNGMAASDRIFKLLDLPGNNDRTVPLDSTGEIMLRDLHFGYDKEKEILHGINASFAEGSFNAIVGESGCGKSTLAAILTGAASGYKGSVTIAGKELAGICEADLMKNITLVSHNSVLFKGCVRENLLMGCPEASDAKLWDVLEQVRLADFLRQQNGLDTELLENASNLSGGQRQRLALARALLHDSPVYIFDEATSNIDVESENDIMQLIHALAHHKTVILISHRLANCTKADQIYVLEHGSLTQHGTHEELLTQGGKYRFLWEEQQKLEQFGAEGRCVE